MEYAVGIDVGSTQTKAVALDTARAIVARVLIDSGANVVRAGQRAMEEIQKAGISRGDIQFVVGTGYGRYKIEAGDTQVTEISCHARGAHMLYPGTRTVIDMGGQDTKAIKISADVLGLTLDEIGEISLRGTKPVRLTSVCTVFVESDILSHLAQNKLVEDILAGVHEAIATRTIGLVRRVGMDPEITFTGGVARNIGMVRALEAKLHVTLNASPEAQYCGALGAALYAMDHVLAEKRPSVAVGSEPAVWVDE